MSLIKSLAIASQSEDSATETHEIKIQSLTASIDGKHGKFRQFQMNNETYNVSESRIENVALFKPNCDGTLTIQQYKNSEGEIKTIIAGLRIHIPTGAGLFVMQ